MVAALMLSLSCLQKWNRCWVLDDTSAKMDVGAFVPGVALVEDVIRPACCLQNMSGSSLILRH